MATDDFSGDYLRTIDGTVVHSPASPILSSMISAGQYLREQSTVGTTETDNVAIAVDRTYLIRMNRSFENQKLLSQFAFHAVQITDYVIRLTHRSLAGVYTLQEAMAQVGLSAPTLSDSAFASSGNTAAWTAMNTSLAEFGISIWRA